MELTARKRSFTKKSEIKQLRREGLIPAILYSLGKEGVQLSVNTIDFQKIIKNIVPGSLPTTLFELTVDGKHIRALVKDIQYHPTSYNVIHLDFLELHSDVPVSVKVPVECLGILECAGVKLGGTLRQIMRHVKVRCLPKKMPSSFEIDVRELGMNQSRMVSDIDFPEGVRPLVPENAVVSVGKR